MTSLATIEAWARAELSLKNSARERALLTSRQLIRTCANAIRAAHRANTEETQGLLTAARALQRSLSSDLESHPDIFYAGYVQDALKEFAEAVITCALISEGPPPDPTSLGVPAAPFLNGLAESVGELRRYILDQLRQGDTSRCEEVLRVMDDVYSLLVSMDYPDALTGGLRRSTDSVRAIMERTRGDLTFALRQDRLEGLLGRVASEE